MFRLDYHISEDDYLAFNEYHCLESRQGKKSLLLYRLLIPLFCLVILLYMLIRGSDSTLLAILAVVLGIWSVIWFFISKKICYRSLRKKIKNIGKQGKMPYANDGTLIFDETSIQDINTVTESKTSYSNIENIVIHNRAIYLYFSALQAYIVPMNCFHSEEEKQEFLRFLSTMKESVKADSK